MVHHPELRLHHPGVPSVVVDLGSVDPGHTVMVSRLGSPRPLLESVLLAEVVCPLREYLLAPVLDRVLRLPRLLHLLRLEAHQLGRYRFRLQDPVAAMFSRVAPLVAMSFRVLLGEVS